MEFDLRDIRAAIESFPAREEGETAFPDCDTVKRVVRGAGRNRRTAEERERRMADEAAERRRRETHPEEFEPITPADLEAMAEKLPNFEYTLPKEKVIPEPKMETCPHCSKNLFVSTNIRFWSAKELYEMAVLKEELERIAAKNREEQLKRIQSETQAANPVPGVEVA